MVCQTVRKELIGTELDVVFPTGTAGKCGGRKSLHKCISKTFFLWFKGWCYSHCNLRPIIAIVDPDKIDIDDSAWLLEGHTVGFKRYISTFMSINP